MTDARGLMMLDDYAVWTSNNGNVWRSGEWRVAKFAFARADREWYAIRQGHGGLRNKAGRLRQFGSARAAQRAVEAL